MTNGERWTELRKQANLALDKFVENGGFDIDEVNASEKVTVPIDCLTPGTVGEWDDAEAGSSRTEGAIHIAADKDAFIIRDGHNRVKDAISKGLSEIDAIVEYTKY